METITGWQNVRHYTAEGKIYSSFVVEIGAACITSWYAKLRYQVEEQLRNK